ncbi:MAG TPA: phosphodiester glycosidase family protein [Thermoanaerobaculia bacterium]|jgi:exopolysaccharide biosynthesis protein|nr:phosphodiester glycosidase family protein [Thermoanaerobaculia bacterium]
MARVLLLLFLATGALGEEWRGVAPGVEYRRAGDVHVARIDLKHPRTKVIASAQQERGLTIGGFAKRTKAVIAINGDYFDEAFRTIGKAGGACGVWWEGKRVSRRQGLVTIGAGRAEIQANTQQTRGWGRGAVSGWPLLVDGCAPVAKLPGSDSFTNARHPRTAVGLTRDGKTLLFVVAMGEGMTLPELARFLVKEAGACRAMNLDGGSSSAMWVRDAVVTGRDPRVGNHLAVVGADDYSGCGEKKTR